MQSRLCGDEHRGGGRYVFVADERAVALLMRLFAVGARAYHCRHVEVTEAEHTQLGNAHYDEGHTYWEKNGRAAHDVAEWQQDEVTNFALALDGGRPRLCCPEAQGRPRTEPL